MNCQTFRDDIPSLLQAGDHALAPPHSTHVESCDECQLQWDTALDAWQLVTDDAGNIDVPSDELRKTFDARLTRSAPATVPRAPIRRLRVGRPVLLKAAASVVLLSIGFFVGRVTDSELVDPPASSVTDLQARLVRAQLQSPRPTARLEAIHETYEMNRLGDDVTSALLAAIRNDPNVNVRLAAIDALSRFADELEVRDGLQQSIQLQKSPLIQTTIYEVLE